MLRTTILLPLLLIAFGSSAQFQSIPFSKVEIKSDTFTFSSRKNVVTINKETRLYFNYSSEEEVCEIRLYPEDPAGLKGLKLLPSVDFELLDSMINLNNEFIRLKVKFVNLSSTNFLDLIFSYIPAGKDSPVLFRTTIFGF